MFLSASLVCLVLGWNPPKVDAKAPAFDVMQVKSGVELVVKRDGEPLVVRLLGIDTPRPEGSDAATDRLNQTNRLRKLVEVGSKVRLVEEAGAIATAKGTILAHVFRDKDDAWVNRLMIEQGYAVAASKPPSAHLGDLQYAESKARNSRLGMFAADYAASADRPTKYDRPVQTRTTTRKRPRPFTPFPPGGGLPALGLGEQQANTNLPMYIPVPYPVNSGFNGYPGLGFGSGLGMGMGTGFGPLSATGLPITGFGGAFAGPMVGGFAPAVSGPANGVSTPPATLTPSERNMQAIQELHRTREQQQNQNHGTHLNR
jgi:endonuclease YncB( thermonuclease family)